MQLTINFDGATFDPALDGARLSYQLRTVFEFMVNHANQYFTLAEIHSAIGFPEASISARLRDLRKPLGGCHTISRRRRTTGTWEYSLIRSQPCNPPSMSP